MFIDLIKIWYEQDFSSKIVEEFVSMLESSEEMLNYVFKILTQNTIPYDFEEKIYKKDQSINFTERNIRKRILIHLSTNPNSNLPACLALISVSKDAERLGDYIKNLFELKKLLKDSKCDSGLFIKLFEKTGSDVEAMFIKVSDAFKNSDREMAIESTNKGREIANRCEEIIEEVASSDYSARQAVVLALGARYIKRIALHLSNIASSVTNPLPDVDYFEKKNPEEK